MSDFSEVKVGDIVAGLVEVAYGWSKSEKFYLPLKVTRVTPTQFLCGDVRYRKKNGQEVGSYFNLRKFGEDLGKGKKVVDQTKEYNAFKEKIAREKALNSVAYNFRIPENSNIPWDKVVELTELIKEVKAYYE